MVGKPKREEIGLVSHSLIENEILLTAKAIKSTSLAEQKLNVTTN